jgi:hypothetical protein
LRHKAADELPTKIESLAAQVKKLQKEFSRNTAGVRYSADDLLKDGQRY